MSVSALFRGRFLLGTVPPEASDSDLTKMLEELSESVRRLRSKGVIIDVSALDVIDSFTCRVLQSMGGALRLRGAEVVVVGIQPGVAFVLARLGLHLDGVETALDIDNGLDLLNERIPVGS